MDICFYNIVQDRDISVKVYKYKTKQHNLNILFSKIYNYSKYKEKATSNLSNLYIIKKLNKIEENIEELFYNLDSSIKL